MVNLLNIINYIVEVVIHMDNCLNEDLILDKKITDIKVAMKEIKNIRMYKLNWLDNGL